MYLRSCQLWVWLVRHTAFVPTHFRVVHDGIAALRRLIGKPLNGTVAGFSEQVMGKLAKKKKKKKKKKPGSTKNVRRCNWRPRQFWAFGHCQGGQDPMSVQVLILACWYTELLDRKLCGSQYRRTRMRTAPRESSSWIRGCWTSLA